VFNDRNETTVAIGRDRSLYGPGSEARSPGRIGNAFRAATVRERSN